jgi:hypothetical protein
MLIFVDFSKHVSASNCHHQGGRSALEATQARSVLWMYVDCDSSSVVSCRGMQLSRKLNTDCRDANIVNLHSPVLLRIGYVRGEDHLEHQNLGLYIKWFLCIFHLISLHGRDVGVTDGSILKL